ncbi:MAG: sulfatase-like hydrolase/transferase [Sphaerochaetaceae bacterium]|nr:sulfatase-like hydrolase/transferase [Sphaerochaetaceae bacterium]
MKNNVLVIFVDELRTDALSMYGNKQVLTPELDKLSSGGTVYSNHFCSCPICTPSRFSMLSGLYATEHSVWENKGTLKEVIDTYPKIMRRNGYKTVAIGKMHSSPTYLDVGFDKMLLSEQDGDGRFEDDYHEFLYEHCRADTTDIIDQRAEYRMLAGGEYYTSFGCRVSNLEEPYHSTSWVTSNVIKELQQWTGEGNFLFASYIKPHHPFDPIERFVDLYAGRRMEILPGYTSEVPKFDYQYDKGYFDNATLSEDILQRMTLYYYANISHIDEGISEMIYILKQKGLYDNTLIIFTSDHGDYMGFHHMALKQNHMYDPLMRIPLIIKRPGQTESSCVMEFSDNTQLAHAILSEIGLEDGLRMNHTDLDAKREYLYGMYKHRLGDSEENAYMVRSERYKLLVTGNVDNYQLYDLFEDPYELMDVSKKQEFADILNKLFAHLFNQLCFSNPPMNYYNPKAAIISKSREAIAQQSEKLGKYFASSCGL